MTTPAQIKANHRNGRLSTGPTTEAGKAKGAPGIKFVVSYGYSVAYATEAVLLPLKAVCRP